MTRSAAPLELLIRFAFSGVGSVLLAFGLWFALQNAIVIYSYEHSMAEVVRCERTGPVSSKGLNSYFVQVRVEDVRGSRTAEVDRSHTNYEVGEVIDVYYKPETSYVVIAGDFMQMWLPVSVLGLAGVMFLFFGVKTGKKVTHTIN
jgi:hypothetical protein